MPEIVIRYGETDVDAVAIHRFLMEVAQPVLLGRIDVRKSLFEVMRVIREGVAILAELDGQIVGTLGLIRATFWYSDDSFLADRFFFARPELRNLGVGGALLGEAAIIAHEAGMPLVITGKLTRRAKRLGNGVYFAPQQAPESPLDLPAFLPTRH